MTVDEAVKVLRVHNAWRRDHENSWERAPHSPAEIGQAIDIVCHVADMGAPPGYHIVPDEDRS